MSDSLLIVGASVRAAASSAVRAGFHPACADLFADVDLRRLGPALATSDFPHGLSELARQLPAGPWIYTGGIENYPEIVEAISRERLLYGNPPATLRAVRNPTKLAAALDRHALKFPECRLSAQGLPADGSWLRKRFHSSGGLGVQAWRGMGLHLPDDAYFQRRITGVSCASIYMAARGQARLLGVTRQLLMAAGQREGVFRYRGSVGPLLLEPESTSAWQRIGEALAAEFDLQGLFGVDAVVDWQGNIWPVEVNPRYTASVEVLERGLGLAAMGQHVVACRDGRFTDEPMAAHSAHGKAIVYAPFDLQMTDDLLGTLDQKNKGRVWPCVADLPRPGTIIRRGQPWVTIFAEADDPLEIELRLETREQALLQLAQTIC